VKCVTATLRLEESVRIQDHERTRLFERIVYERCFPLVQHEAGQFGWSLPIPAPGTMIANVSLGDAKLIWYVRIDVRLPLWPDWHATIPLMVRYGSSGGSVSTMGYTLAVN
jgi:hypothetical protein